MQLEYTTPGHYGCKSRIQIDSLDEKEIAAVIKKLIANNTLELRGSGAGFRAESLRVEPVKDGVHVTCSGQTIVAHVYITSYGLPLAHSSEAESGPFVNTLSIFD